MTDKTIIVSARVKAQDDHVDRIAYVLKALIEPTRKEEGCISYDFHQSVNDKTVFISYEIWTSQEAFLSHLETPYIKALEDISKDILALPLEINIMEKLG